MNGAKILIVEDDKEVRNYLADVLAEDGYSFKLAGDADEGVRAVAAEHYDLMILDLRLPRGGSGLDVLKAAKQHDPEVSVVIMTAFSDEDDERKAIGIGALDYIIRKPASLDELKVRVRNCLKQVDLSREKFALEQDNIRTIGMREIVGTSPAIQEVKELIKKIASSNIKTTVMIRGETGTGKELVARAIHQQSNGPNSPFLVVNTGAETLLESQLFGHEKGAFTGATERKLGWFERAHGGTIFLDEIGDFSPNLQVKLLRVIQFKEFERVGGRETIKTNVRIIVATHKNLEEQIKRGLFREDLYYRINVFPIFLPPLRDRKDDIMLLANHFLEKKAADNNKKISRISTPAIEILTRYHWPGNVRELENIIERAVILSDASMLLPSHLPLELQCQGVSMMTMPTKLSGRFAEDKKRVIEQFERNYLVAALKKANGIVTRAAVEGEIGRKVFGEKCKKYGINPRDFRPRTKA